VPWTQTTQCAGPDGGAATSNAPGNTTTSGKQPETHDHHDLRHGGAGRRTANRIGPARRPGGFDELINEAAGPLAHRYSPDLYYARRVASAPFRYQSPDEDSGRWLGFPFRDGDIVISARSKTGTTWVQTICALLIFQTPRLPAPLAQLSPWLDHLIAPRDQMYARLAAQEHRRVIKTHTPLDGIPLDSRATYIVTARHPLDMAVSLYHQGDNIDRARVRQLTGQPEPSEPPRPRKPLHDWLLRWIADDDDPRKYPDSLPGVMWHLSDAWARRGRPNMLLVHYDNLLADLEGQMRWLAGQLGITVPQQAWPELVRAATFESMSGSADTLVPTAGIFKSNAAFFRRGTSGAGREILGDEEIAAYHARTAQLAPPDMLTWLHSPRQDP
jgi:aryl sulfotransferase